MGKELIVENIANVDEKYSEKFYQAIEKLDEKIKFLVATLGYKIILANKQSEVYSKEQLQETVEELKKYEEDYDVKKLDEIIRGTCSDTIKAICVFADNVRIENINFILYHEIGHFLDIYNETGIFQKFFLSSQKEFVQAYETDIKEHWEKIKQDNRKRLLHLIQNSTPKNNSSLAMAETFANCFAKMMKSIDEIDFIELYFKNSYQITKKIIKEKTQVQF